MPFPSAKLVTVQVGLPKTIASPTSTDPETMPWTTGFYKSPVADWVNVTRTNIDGDGQADLINHGGIDKAILVYSAEHFEAWMRELDVDAIIGGMFGENLTVVGQTESTVCIGDRFRINDVVLEVSQPRQPCWKLGRRWGIKLLPKLVVKTARCGWYCRVITEGRIKRDLPIEIMSRAHRSWNIKRAHEKLFDQNSDAE